MTQTHAGWIVFVAALGMMAGLLGAEVSQMQDWSAAVSPAFIGKGLIHFGTVTAAFVGGKLLPQAGGQ